MSRASSVEGDCVLYLVENFSLNFSSWDFVMFFVIANFSPDLIAAGEWPRAVITAKRLECLTMQFSRFCQEPAFSEDLMSFRNLVSLWKSWKESAWRWRLFSFRVVLTFSKSRVDNFFVFPWEVFSEILVGSFKRLSSRSNA